MHRHQAHAPACRKGHNQLLENLWAARKTALTSRLQQSSAVDHFLVDEDPTHFNAHNDDVHNDQLVNQCVQVENLPDDDWQGETWREGCPLNTKAGASHGTASTPFETIRDEEVLGVGEIWGPFKSEGEWQLVKWLIKNVGHGQAEEFLRLNIIQHKLQPSFQNKTDLLDAVDHLPQSVEWKCECITLTGDVRDDDGNAETEELELWFRCESTCGSMAKTPQNQHKDKCRVGGLPARTLARGIGYSEMGRGSAHLDD
ncbi:hypothetical protein EDD15DRAFT_2374584 [Pisolithus albus]|nr:hypothetical protein EDD15DRAFT_2374584 [Pisolithus albus]